MRRQTIGGDGHLTRAPRLSRLRLARLSLRSGRTAREQLDKHVNHHQLCNFLLLVPGSPLISTMTKTGPAIRDHSRGQHRWRKGQARRLPCNSNISTSKCCRSSHTRAQYLGVSLQSLVILVKPLADQPHCVRPGWVAMPKRPPRLLPSLASSSR